jgi:hypothetical protein
MEKIRGKTEILFHFFGGARGVNIKNLIKLLNYGI